MANQVEDREEEEERGRYRGLARGGIPNTISQTLPSEVQETCGCPVPTVIMIEDNVEMSMVLRENKEAIPVQVGRLSTCAVGLQQSSRG